MLNLKKNLFLKIGLLTILWSMTNIDHIFPVSSLDTFRKSQEELSATKHKVTMFQLSRQGPVRAVMSAAKYMKPAASKAAETARPLIDQGKITASRIITKLNYAAPEETGTTSPRLQAPAIAQNIPRLTDANVNHTQSATPSWWTSLTTSIGSGLNSAKSWLIDPETSSTASQIGTQQSNAKDHTKTTNNESVDIKFGTITGESGLPYELLDEQKPFLSSDSDDKRKAHLAIALAIFAAGGTLASRHIAKILAEKQTPILSRKLDELIYALRYRQMNSKLKSYPINENSIRNICEPVMETLGGKEKFGDVWQGIAIPTKKDMQLLLNSPKLEHLSELLTRFNMPQFNLAQIARAEARKKSLNQSMLPTVKNLQIKADTLEQEASVAKETASKAASKHIKALRKIPIRPGMVTVNNSLQKRASSTQRLASEAEENSQLAREKATSARETAALEEKKLLEFKPKYYSQEATLARILEIKDEKAFKALYKASERIRKLYDAQRKR